MAMASSANMACATHMMALHTPSTLCPHPARHTAFVNNANNSKLRLRVVAASSAAQDPKPAPAKASSETVTKPASKAEGTPAKPPPRGPKRGTKVSS